MGCAPDLDYFVQWGECYIWQCNTIIAVHHGDFHNLAALAAFTIIGVYIFSKWGNFNWKDAAICSFLGYTAHLWEDWFVYRPAYTFLWPFTDTYYGGNIIHETSSLWGWGDPYVFAFGFLLLGIAITLKMHFCGKDWIKEEFNSFVIPKISSATIALNNLIVICNMKLQKKN